MANEGDVLLWLFSQEIYILWPGSNPFSMFQRLADCKKMDITPKVAGILRQR
jgi:hypothetical protein